MSFELVVFELTVFELTVSDLYCDNFCTLKKASQMNREFLKFP